MTDTLYHILMLLAVVALLYAVWRWPTWTTLVRAAIAGVACAGLFALVFAGVDGRLFSMGFFWHGGAFLLLAGVLLLIKKERKPGGAAIVLAFLVIGVAVDAFIIEPAALTVETYELSSDAVDEPLRIIFITDIQTDHVGEYDRRAIQRVKELKPDLLLLGGDYVHPPRRDLISEERTALGALLREIDLDPPLGAFAVQGNVDTFGDGDWTGIFRETNILPVNSTEQFDLGPIVLTCLSEPDSFDSHMKVRRPESDQPQFHIVLGHCPSYACGAIDADLCLAGHTHGGQIQLPGYGPIITLSPDLPRRWGAGMTELTNGGRLLVSRGVGMERGRAPRVRFFCTPEISVIKVKPKE